MEYLIISFTHKNTDIKTREQIAFSNDVEKKSFLKEVLVDKNINEAIVLSTCNRVEVITSLKASQVSIKHIINLLSIHSSINEQELSKRADIYTNENAIHHLFTVSSSLDSLVIGETQIAGQLKEAYRTGVEWGFAGNKISQVIHYSLKCAARVRNVTALGSGSVSIASTAVARAKQIFKNNLEIQALVVGAGEMSELACKHLLKSGFNVILCSRNIKKARILAHTILQDNISSPNTTQIVVKPYDELEQLLHKIPLLFSATSAPYPVITKKMVQTSNIKRYWFDIALPQDIENIEIDNLHIFNVDDLQNVVDETLNIRASKAKEAYQIVNAMTKEFYIWLQKLSVEPLIKEIYQKSNTIIEKKINNAMRKKFILETDESNIKKLCQSIMSEFLHTTTNKLRIASNSNEDDTILNATYNLFEINEEKLLSKTGEIK